LSFPVSPWLPPHPYPQHQGHVHNFYIQNVRNNKNNRRTPKWAQRYGLVDTTTIKRHEKRSEWAKRYNERNPHSTLEDQQFEDGQAAGSSSRTSLDPGAGASAVRPQQTGGGELWNPDEEQYYNGRSDAASGQSTSRWHYPANFEDTMPAAEPPRKKKIKKDRHARVEDAYSMPADDPSRHRRKKKKRSSTARADDYATTYSRSSTADGPEDPEAAAYAAGARSGRAPANAGGGAAAANANGDDIFQHEF
jgi:hypothetical protein